MTKNVGKIRKIMIAHTKKPAAYVAKMLRRYPRDDLKELVMNGVSNVGLSDAIVQPLAQR